MGDPGRAVSPRAQQDSGRKPQGLSWRCCCLVSAEMNPHPSPPPPGAPCALQEVTSLSFEEENRFREMAGPKSSCSRRGDYRDYRRGEGVVLEHEGGSEGRLSSHACCLSGLPTL